MRSKPPDITPQGRLGADAPPQAIASAFIADFIAGREPELSAIDQLCAMAVKEEQPTARPALNALYGSIIETLCDDFTTSGMQLTARVLGRLLDFTRATEPGREMNELLNSLGLPNSDALLARYTPLTEPRPLDLPANSIKKILIPSRVTIGADVAISGVLAQRAHRCWPTAEILLVGPNHLPQLFAELPGVRYLPLAYERYGGLVERITGWPRLYHIARREQADLPPNAMLVLDPDSRLTQLGLLPLTAASHSRIFPSRTDVSDLTRPCLAELANHWCDRVLGQDSHQWPVVTPHPEYHEAARRFMAGGDDVFFLILSPGVGNNEKKRIPDPFEQYLVRALLELPNTVVLVDSGTRQRGRQRVTDLLAAMRSSGVSTTFLREEELAETTLPFKHGVIGFQGSIGAMAGLMQRARGFFGYDSCCQHIAAALDLPSVIAFAGAPNDRFRDRWRSQGRHGHTHIIAVNSDTVYTRARIEALAREAAAAFRRIYQSTPGLLS